MSFIDFFKEGTDSSSKRLVLIVSGITMSIGILVLCYAAFTRDVSNELWALTIPLSTMAGVSYTAVERMRLAKKEADKEKIEN